MSDDGEHEAKGYACAAFSELLEGVYTIDHKNFTTFSYWTGNMDEI